MAVSRIAHYLKAMMRDKVGSFTSAGNVEAFLNDWLSQYVLLDDGASQEAKAQYPLREASIKVVENPAEPGHYKSVVFLRPHFQLDELSYLYDWSLSYRSRVIKTAAKIIRIFITTGKLLK